MSKNANDNQHGSWQGLLHQRGIPVELECGESWEGGAGRIEIKVADIIPLTRAKSMQ